MKRNVVQRILSFNKGRNEERLELKFQHLRADSFSFFRGTAHLFYEDWPGKTHLNDVPAAWICGDLHLQNFGSYKGDNRLVYFDLNDFDEAVLAPCTWDVARFLTSILVARHALGLHQKKAWRLCKDFLQAYTTGLAIGKAGMVEEATATGVVKQLLKSVTERKQEDMLARRTVRKGDKRRLVLDGQHLAPVTERERSAVESFMGKWASKQPHPGFFKVLDVAHRIAGVGSLGVDRYALLVEGKGSPDQNYLLDLKEEPRSALALYSPSKQPRWNSEAERVVFIQFRMQGVCPALLEAVMLGGRSYVLRELQPVQDRVDLANCRGKMEQLRGMIETMGRLTAWSQLRSGGRQGSAIADDLIAFAPAPGWKPQALQYAQAYAKQVEADYQEFCSQHLPGNLAS